MLSNLLHCWKSDNHRILFRLSELAFATTERCTKTQGNRNKSLRGIKQILLSRLNFCE